MAEIHPSSDVQSKSIGKGTRIWQYVVILPGAVIGENCNICAHCFIENDVRIGNNVTLKSGVQLWDGVRLEDDVFVGPSAAFVNNNHPRSRKYPEKHVGAYVEKGATIGANATLLGGIRIGHHAMIGAGSTVTRDVPGNTLWYGNPARQNGYVCDCGIGLTADLKCPDCGESYRIEDKQIVKNTSQ